MATTLILPGLNDSGPGHWQTWLEPQLRDVQRINQMDWTRPDLDAWVAEADAVLDRLTRPALLIAHSFGCLTAVTAAARQPESVAGLLLVAPADPAKFGVATRLPRVPFAVSSILVASRDDPWMDFASAVGWAQCWGSRVVDLGRAGHINAESGFGPWPLALDLYAELAQNAGFVERSRDYALITRTVFSDLSRPVTTPG